MRLLEINGVTDKNILKKLYTSMKYFHIEKSTYLIYNLNILNYVKINDFVDAHAIVVDINDFEHIDLSIIEDVLMDLAELNNPIILKSYTGKNTEFVTDITEKINDLGIMYKNLDDLLFNQYIDLCNLSLNNFGIISEILTEKTPEIKFSSLDFAIRLTLNSDGVIRDTLYNTEVLDLKQTDFVEILSYTPDYLYDLYREENILRSLSIPLNNCLYEPWIFIFENDNISKRVIEYKLRVFEEIKNILPVQYPQIHPDLVQLLNENDYITYNDIIKIIKRENDYVI